MAGVWYRQGEGTAGGAPAALNSAACSLLAVSRNSKNFIPDAFFSIGRQIGNYRSASHDVRLAGNRCSKTVVVLWSKRCRSRQKGSKRISGI